MPRVERTFVTNRNWTEFPAEVLYDHTYLMKGGEIPAIYSVFEKAINLLDSEEIGQDCLKINQFDLASLLGHEGQTKKRDFRCPFYSFIVRPDKLVIAYYLPASGETQGGLDYLTLTSKTTEGVILGARALLLPERAEFSKSKFNKTGRMTTDFARLRTD